MLMSSALVLVMVPGLALFYAGTVRRKNVLTTMMQSFVAMGLIDVQWTLFGYCLVFGKIFILPLEDCIRIRTGERGGGAI